MKIRLTSMLSKARAKDGTIVAAPINLNRSVEWLHQQAGKALLISFMLHHSRQRLRLLSSRPPTTALKKNNDATMKIRRGSCGAHPMHRVTKTAPLTPIAMPDSMPLQRSLISV